MPVHGSATVVGIPKVGEYGTTVNMELAGRTWRATLADCPTVGLGDRIEVDGVGLPLREGSERFLLLHGVTGRLQVREAHLLEPGPRLWQYAASWRHSFSDLTAKWLPPESAALTQALCFDLNGELDPKTTDRLRQTGTIHVVSASGLHVFLIAASLMGLLSLLPIPRGAQVLLVGLLLTMYAGATGLSPPVVRAVLMSIVGLSAYLFRRERDALSALAFAGVIYLLWQPRQVYDPGFQLSFVTVGAMALFLHRRPKRHLAREKLEEALWVSWVAFLASTPLVAYHFGGVSLSALPANLLVALPVSVAVISAFLAQILGWILPALGVGILSCVTGPMSGAVLWLVEHLSGPGWYFEVPGFSAYLLPLFYGLLLLTWRQRIVHP
ncbi:ComEC/Rec2 family competence protein [Fimbriimonas ginsengisoli]|nr:ComEC/Rec2 family competence protein [Fimbriimonas ginsengisoli]